MEESKTKLEILLDQAQRIGTTSIQLYRLQAIDKIAKLVAVLVVVLSVTASAFLVLLFSSIALALWLEQYLGFSYAGFILVGIGYAILGGILYFLRAKLMIHPIRNLMIKLLLKD